MEIYQSSDFYFELIELQRKNKQLLLEKEALLLALKASEEKLREFQKLLGHDRMLDDVRKRRVTQFVR